MIKKCKFCGKEFSSNDKRKIFCCRKCKDKYYDLQKKLNNPNNLSIPRVCKICGKEFIAKTPNACICSDECRLENSRIRDRERNKTERRKQWFKDRETKPERIKYRKETSGRWHKQHRDHINSYIRTRYKTDINFRLKEWSRKQVKRCLKSKDNKKTNEILQYTPEQLKQRIEFQFKPDMSWDNYGTLWHVDHKKPLTLFNYILPNGEVDLKQIRVANSLANLQPLYAQDNLSKGGKFGVNLFI